MRGILLCLLFTGLSQAAEVYLNPSPSLPSYLTPSHASSVISRHLRLEAFEPLQGNEQIATKFLNEPFVGEGDKNGLLLSIDEADAKDVLPESLKPTFSLSNSPDITSFSSLISTYLHRAPQAYTHIFSLPSYSAPVPRLLDIFSVSSSATESFLTEISGLVSFLESDDDGLASDKFGAFELTGLGEIASAYGRSSEQYTLAAETLRAVLLGALDKKDINLVVLTFNGARANAPSRRQPPQSPLPPTIPQQPINSVSTCYTSESECGNATSACSGRGSCVSATKAGKTCFVCACAATKDEKGRTENWAGQACERKDVSGPFVLLAGTVVALLLLVVGSVGLLYGIGNQELPSVLTGGVTGGQKKD
ncbi:hypothetical protein EW146_g4553 [Bondarzewia mesenterica]|uniref:Vacuolar sorting protein Vps3844 C-terminal domain-containing protein n=1 Tax=Bondarzewia mesenterica TaxID=1095465 RepID=A0A4S4LU71_9AGAM|nr:hypothetical protein EW146_g4553 [Bondarzewia mesenterica]